MCFYPWHHFLLVFSADGDSIASPGRMFCCFSALLFLNDIWHLTSGFSVCCINGSEPDSICCFHQTICQPLKLGHAVLLICDVTVLGRIWEIKYSKYSWWRTFLVKYQKRPKLVVAVTAEMKRYLILRVRPQAWFSSPTRWEHGHWRWQAAAVISRVTECLALTRMQKMISRPAIFPAIIIDFRDRGKH